MGSLGPSIKSNNPSPRSADISVPAASLGGLAGRAYSSNVMCAKVDMSSMALAWTDNGASGGYTSQKIIDFPEGKILILGATANLTAITLGSGLGASSTTFVVSLGTSAEATGTTLDSVQANIIPSTAVTIATSAGTVFASSTAVLTAAATDGHTTAIDAYINFAADGTDSTGTVTAANGGLTVSGTIYLWYINLGD